MQPTIFKSDSICNVEVVGLGYKLIADFSVRRSVEETDEQ